MCSRKYTLAGLMVLAISLAGCASAPEMTDEQWGNDVRTRDVDIEKTDRHRISFSDEVDIMRDVDERQKW